MATFASAVDFELPDDAAEDSHDLSPLLKGEVDSVRDSHIHNTYENRRFLFQNSTVAISHPV